MADDSIGQFMTEVLSNLQSHMKSGIPPMGIPPLDPLSLANFNFSVNESSVNCKAFFKNTVLTGLSTITFPKIEFDGASLKVSVTANVKELEARGKYNLDGTAIVVVPLEGDGDMLVEAEAVTMTIGLSLSSTDILNARIEVFGIKFDVGSIKINFSNLEGGGNLGNILNQILSLLGKRIFDFVKPSISHEVENALQKLIDYEIQKRKGQVTSVIDLSLIGDKMKNLKFPAASKVVLANSECSAACRSSDHPTSKRKAQPGNLNVLFDKIITNVNHMLSKDHDPWYVNEDAKTSFHEGWGPFQIRGGAKLDDIEIYGLSNLERTGDVTLSSSPPTLSLKVGVNGRVHGEGRWNAWLKPVDISGSASVTVRNISIAAEIALLNDKGRIKEIRFSKTPDINVDLDGLEPLTWILSQFANAIVAVLSPWLNDIVVPFIKDALQEELDKVKIPF